jgi:indolepyruvate ferredoxin oxidoreductase alpha subunit
VVTSYAGAPVTAVVNEILAQTTADEVQVHWTSNEKTAIEIAFGASLGGARALLCVKSVGLNVALDPLMAFNLTGCHAGLVLLVGDDPGGWGSQNEQDSRMLAAAAEIPLIEPTSVLDAWKAITHAFQLSEEMGQPVMVRITRALVLATDKIQPPETPEQLTDNARPSFQREFMRWVVLPVNVVPNHRRLHARLAAIRASFEESTLNQVQGDGPLGIVAAGFAYHKLIEALAGNAPPGLRVLRLGTIHPFPAQQATSFVRSVESVLVLEETAPCVEQALRLAAQMARLTTPIYGRDTGHIDSAGEIFAPHIAAALNRLAPHLALPTGGVCSRPMPSRQALCEECPYIPTFDALIEVMERMGGRDRFVVVGDPGCMVRAQLPPYQLLDVKNSLGSSIGQAAGLAAGQAAGTRKDLSEKRIVALSGDSSFLHSGLAGLIDAARIGVRMFVLILDNGTTALSGGQSHPASQLDARGRPQPALDLARLAREAGAGRVQVVNLSLQEDIQAAIEAGIRFEGVAVVVARGPCTRWPAPGGAETRS